MTVVINLPLPYFFGTVLDITVRKRAEALEFAHFLGGWMRDAVIHKMPFFAFDRRF
jgi:hypothetical protein